MLNRNNVDFKIENGKLKIYNHVDEFIVSIKKNKKALDKAFKNEGINLTYKLENGIIIIESEFKNQTLYDIVINLLIFQLNVCNGSPEEISELLNGKTMYELLEKEISKYKTIIYKNALIVCNERKIKGNEKKWEFPKQNRFNWILLIM